MTGDLGLIALGRAVTLARERAGMTVEELADSAGVDHACVGALEAGSFDPGYDLLLGIADGLNTRLSTLVSSAERPDHAQP